MKTVDWVKRFFWQIHGSWITRGSSDVPGRADFYFFLTGSGANSVFLGIFKIKYDVILSFLDYFGYFFPDRTDETFKDHQIIIKIKKKH